MQFEHLGRADPHRTDRKMMFRVKACEEDNGTGGMYLHVRVPNIGRVWFISVLCLLGLVMKGRLRVQQALFLLCGQFAG